MAIFGIEGGIGTGKTLTGVYFAYNDLLDGKKLFTNVVFRNLPKKLSKKIIYLKKEIVNDMLKQIKDGKLDMTNSTVLIQEMHNYMDSRSSMSTKNKTLTYWILQSRHTGKGSCDIVYDTQELSQVDIRLRNNTDHVIRPLIVSMSEDDKPRDILVSGTTKKFHSWVNYNSVIHVYPMLELYDTHEVVDF